VATKLNEWITLLKMKMIYGYWWCLVMAYVYYLYVISKRKISCPYLKKSISCFQLVWSITLASLTTYHLEPFFVCFSNI
jgi:hypothetical protein